MGSWIPAILDIFYYSLTQYPIDGNGELNQFSCFKQIELKQVKGVLCFELVDWLKTKT